MRDDYDYLDAVWERPRDTPQALPHIVQRDGLLLLFTNRARCRAGSRPVAISRSFARLACCRLFLRYHLKKTKEALK